MFSTDKLKGCGQHRQELKTGLERAFSASARLRNLMFDSRIIHRSSHSIDFRILRKKTNNNCVDQSGIK